VRHISSKEQHPLGRQLSEGALLGGGEHRQRGNPGGLDERVPRRVVKAEPPMLGSNSGNIRAERRATQPLTFKKRAELGTDCRRRGG
jgi:hypothetical protein